MKDGGDRPVQVCAKCGYECSSSHAVLHFVKGKRYCGKCVTITPTPFPRRVGALFGKGSLHHALFSGKTLYGGSKEKRMYNSMQELAEAIKKGEVPKEAKFTVDNDFLELGIWREEDDDLEQLFHYDYGPGSFVIELLNALGVKAEGA